MALHVETLVLIAAIVGTVLGAIAAAVNDVQTWDEFLLWVIGGALGGTLAMSAWTGIIVGVAVLVGVGTSSLVSVAAAATTGLLIFTVAGVLGALLTRALDDSNRPVAWFFSLLNKGVQAPLTTTVGLIAALVVAARHGTVDFRRGMVFISAGPGRRALTLGAVAWTQRDCFTPDGTVPDNLARHEAQHSRTVAAIGELGFYLTYCTIGAIWGIAEGGSWNDLNPGTGHGNPFEKTAHTFTNDPGTAVPTGSH